MSRPETRRAPDALRLRAERRLELIEELTGRAMALTRVVHRRAMAEEQDAAEAAEESEGGGALIAASRPGPDCAAATFAMLSRTVRRCLVIEARAEEALRALGGGGPVVQALPAAQPANGAAVCRMREARA